MKHATPEMEREYKRFIVSAIKSLNQGNEEIKKVEKNSHPDFSNAAHKYSEASRIFANAAEYALKNLDNDKVLAAANSAFDTFISEIDLWVKVKHSSLATSVAKEAEDIAKKYHLGEEKEKLAIGKSFGALIELGTPLIKESPYDAITLFVITLEYADYKNLGEEKTREAALLLYEARMEYGRTKDTPPHTYAIGSGYAGAAQVAKKYNLGRNKETKPANLAYEEYLFLAKSQIGKENEYPELTFGYAAEMALNHDLGIEKVEVPARKAYKIISSEGKEEFKEGKFDSALNSNIDSLEKATKFDLKDEIEEASANVYASGLEAIRKGKEGDLSDAIWAIGRVSEALSENPKYKEKLDVLRSLAKELERKVEQLKEDKEENTYKTWAREKRVD